MKKSVVKTFLLGNYCIGIKVTRIKQIGIVLCLRIMYVCMQWKSNNNYDDYCSMGIKWRLEPTSKKNRAYSEKPYE